jgi:hypothetical protein
MTRWSSAGRRTFFPGADLSEMAPGGRQHLTAHRDCCTARQSSQQVSRQTRGRFR